MKKLAIFAAILACSATQSHAGDRYQRSYVAHGHTVVVSCYRGPWREVIWDRPEPVFIDSLVAAGYDYPTANALAERICRDPSLVGNREALRGFAQDVVKSTPPRHRHAAPARRAAPPSHGQTWVMRSTPRGPVYFLYGQ